MFSKETNTDLHKLGKKKAVKVLSQTEDMTFEAQRKATDLTVSNLRTEHLKLCL